MSTHSSSSAMSRSNSHTTTGEEDQSHSTTNRGRGLNDSYTSGRRRKLLDLMNRLMATGAQLDIDLPQISVLGGQSAGKSSLIESISGITLPRASGTCTRCATECLLSYSTNPWQCEVFLRFIVDEDDMTLGQMRETKFGPTIYDRSEVEDRLRNAQLAILNPATSYERFLGGYIPPDGESQLSFSRNYISVRISGPNVADLSFCDLPGLIATVARGGNQGDIQLVESLLKSYIEKPSCLILLTVTCETDFETQGAFTLASHCDPDGTRTIGVLTKPDRIPTGDEVNWVKFIQNEKEPLQFGWFCVKQPDSEQLRQGISWEQARANEAAFFNTWVNKHQDLKDLRSHLGTPKLVSALSDILSELIAKRLPDLQKELQNLLDKTMAEYGKLPKAFTGQPLTEMLGIIDGFKSSIDQLVQGDPDNPNGLMQTIHKKHHEFRTQLRGKAPNFLPYSDFPVFGFLQNEGDKNMDCDGDGREYSLAEVSERAANAWTRELPGFVPYRVTQALIEENISEWKNLANGLLNDVRTNITAHCQDILNDHFSQFNHTGLLNNVTFIMLDHITKRFNDAEVHISWLLSLEEEPFTMSLQLEEYRRNFYSCYYDSQHRAIEMDTGLVSLTRAAHVKMPKMPDHGSDEGSLWIMATVRAYYQVAFKRFADNVALAIDRDLVRGVAKGIRDIFRDKIISGEGSEATDKCRDLLREQPAMAVRRMELRSKLERLNAAKQELMQIF